MTKIIYNKLDYLSIKYNKSDYKKYPFDELYKIYQIILHRIYNNGVTLFHNILYNRSIHNNKIKIIKEIENYFNNVDNIKDDYFYIKTTDKNKSLSFNFIDENYNTFITATFTLYKEIDHIGIDLDVSQICYKNSNQFKLNYSYISEDYIKNIKLISHDDNDWVTIELYGIFYEFKFDPLDYTHEVNIINIDFNKIKNNTLYILFNSIPYQGFLIPITTYIFYEYIRDHKSDFQYVKNIIWLFDNGLKYNTGGVVYIPYNGKGYKLTFYAPGLTNILYKIDDNCVEVENNAFELNNHIKYIIYKNIILYKNKNNKFIIK